MRNYLHQHGQKGQAAVLLALAMIGLLAIVGLALDGGMLYWNQRRAQNGADAAVIAGAAALADEMLTKTYKEECYTLGTSTAETDPILSQVRQFASINEVPDASGGQNVAAYYLTQYSDPDRRDYLINPLTNQAWEILGGETVPCEDIVGIKVKANFPQDTFLAGVIGIAETDVTVEASATFEVDTWCQDFLMFALDPDDSKHVLSLTGSFMETVDGGLHSNGGMQLGGGADEDIHLAEGHPVEFDEDGTESIKCAAITGGPDPTDPVCRGITQVPDYPLPPLYSFDDFAPINLSSESENGYIWNEAKDGERFWYDRTIRTEDVTNPDGTLRNGLYVTTGDIVLNRVALETDLPWTVTLVAKGKISVSGGVNMIAYSRGVLIFTDSDNTADGAVSLSGDNNVWSGQVVAPNGLVTISNSYNQFIGQIFAWRIDASGSNNTYTHSPSNCPVTLPRVLLIQ